MKSVSAGRYGRKNMTRKTLIVLVLSGLIVPAVLFSQSQSSGVATFISSAYSTKTFTTVSVDPKDLEMILHCGVQAPSARNSQPWHFAVTKDLATMKKIVSDAIDGNVLVIISGLDERDHAAAIVFDCALATENMYLAAQSLGLGSHIYTGPIAGLNANYRDLVGVPAGYVAVAILKIGNTSQKVDAVSAASRRNADSDMTDYH
jgi:nitroreductase